MTQSEPGALFEEIHDLVSRQFDGALEADEAARLEALVLNDPQARRLYAAYMIESFGLHWWAGPASEAVASVPAATPRPVPITPAARSGVLTALVVFANRPLVFSLVFATAFVFASLVALRVVPMPGQASESDDAIATRVTPNTEHLATLTASVDCRWQDGQSRPVGAKLAEGELTLTAGFAELRYAQGTTVLVEGPARLRLVSPTSAHLDQGQLIALVPKRARGFQITTPAGVVTDLGTEFGVQVDERGQTDVQVFFGAVQVDAHQTRRRLIAGEAVRVDAPLGPSSAGVRELAVADRPRFVRSLLAGRTPVSLVKIVAEKDGFVHAQSRDKPYGNHPLLEVKFDPQQLQYARKAWLGFDLGAHDRPIVAARLRLVSTYAATSLGRDAPPQQPWRFEVYGLSDNALQSWDEKNLTWNSAPGNDSKRGDQLDPVLTTSEPVAQFELHGEGRLDEAIEIRDERLTAFLNQRAGQAVTLIVVRRTPAHGGDTVAHQFASREHPQLEGPTLELWYDPRPEAGRLLDKQLQRDEAADASP